MDIDDGDCFSPQYIRDDHEVEVFVQMRRKIEEVNLCVTVVKHFHDIKTVLRSAALRNAQEKMDTNEENGSTDNSRFNSKDEWHQFALEQEANADVGLQTATHIEEHPTIQLAFMPIATRGITIRQRVETHRLSKPTCLAGEKGKAILPTEERTDESDWDGHVARYVPCIQQPLGHAWETNNRVRKQLFHPADSLGDVVMANVEAANDTCVEADNYSKRDPLYT